MSVENKTAHEPVLRYFSCLGTQPGRRFGYWVWGDESAKKTIVCYHGLTRQGRDFDELARDLVEHASEPVCVICPDAAGRGQSDWLDDPKGYAVGTYAADMVDFLASKKFESIAWLGTSMGGLVAMAVAAMGAHRAVRLDKLVLNDVGPELGMGALARISEYVGKNMMHGTVAEAADYLRSIGKGFGPHGASQWLELSRHMVRDDGRGAVALHYDPAIALPFKSVGEAAAQAGEAALWAMYDALDCEALLVRGAESDLLSSETARRMAERGPKPRLVEFEGVGHAPTFVDVRQREAVRSFLLG